MRGRHVLKTWSSTQATVALSSAEAELIAAVRGAAEGLAMRSIAGDVGLRCGLRLSLDSSAALGIVKRTGVGKVRHLDTRLLWIQEHVRDGAVEVINVKGEDNAADLMTKHLSGDVIFGHLNRLGGEARQGRARLAPRCTVGACAVSAEPARTTRSGPRRGVKTSAGMPPKCGLGLGPCVTCACVTCAV